MFVCVCALPVILLASTFSYNVHGNIIIIFTVERKFICFIVKVNVMLHAFNVAN